MKVVIAGESECNSHLDMQFDALCGKNVVGGKRMYFGFIGRVLCWGCREKYAEFLGKHLYKKEN